MSSETCIALLLDAPLQAWGAASRFTHRGTEAFPTKSAMIGLIAAALGIRKDANEAENLRPLSALRMTAVSVPKVTDGKETSTQRLVDFHTVAGGYDPDREPMRMTRTADGKINKNPVITNRCYLTDSRFLVLLEGPQDRLARIATALQQPVWGTWFGRKSCIPATPIFVCHESNPANAWKVALAKTGRSGSLENFDHVVEVMGNAQGYTICDEPTAFGAPIGNRHSTRRISIIRRKPYNNAVI